MSAKELPKVCPSCGSHEFQVSSKVTANTRQTFGKGSDNKERRPVQKKGREQATHHRSDYQKVGPRTTALIV